MSKKKKKKTDLRLSADERPLFQNWKRIHRTAKDKANDRQNHKKELRDELKKGE